MTASVWQRPPALRADLAIVGGGVIGAATAYALGRLAPERRVVLVEAERLAHGASGRNAGFLLLGTHSDYASAVAAYGRATARRVWSFTQDAYRAAAEIGEIHDVGYQASGSVLAAGTEAEAERLRQSRDLLADDGVPTTFLDAEGAAEYLGMSGFHGALVVPTGGALDPVRLVRVLAAQSGAEVIERWRACRLESAGGVRIEAEGGSTLLADRVLVAVNAALPLLVPALADVVRPVRAQMLATAPLPPTVRAPVYSHDGFYYVRQRDDGRVLLGGARHLHTAQEVGYEDATTDVLQADLDRYLHDVVGVHDAVVERRWAGTMGFSPDGLPAIGEIPGVPGAYWAAGFTGHGMGYALRFGTLAARRLLDLPDPDADLFRADRLTSA